MKKKDIKETKIYKLVREIVEKSLMNEQSWPPDKAIDRYKELKSKRDKTDLLPPNTMSGIRQMAKDSQPSAKPVEKPPVESHEDIEAPKPYDKHAVLTAQKRLKALGYLPSTITPNGRLGPKTLAAVAKFKQEKMGFKNGNNMMDSAFYAKLKAEGGLESYKPGSVSTKAASPVTNGSSGPRVNTDHPPEEIVDTSGIGNKARKNTGYDVAHPTTKPEPSKKYDYDNLGKLEADEDENASELIGNPEAMRDSEKRRKDLEKSYKAGLDERRKRK